MNEKIKRKLKNKKISILGDSISTYYGYSNEGLYNGTLVSNAVFYYPMFPMTVDKTYWMRIIDEFSLTLCVNNSWSGSYLTKRAPNVGKDDGALLSPGVERVKYLSDQNGVSPDIILVFMGINDLGAGVKANTFKTAYGEVLKSASELYPNADVFCVGMPYRGYLNEETEEYNAAIKDAVRSAGNRFVYADIFYGALSVDG